MMHENWRDCDAWRKQNLRMNSQSNEAVKLFDVSLSQLIGYHDNLQYNGLLGSLKNMLDADPNFILGNCLKTGIELLGSNAFLNSHPNVQVLKEKSILLKDDLTQRELKHVEAIDQLHKGNLDLAINCWESILADNPTDILAVKFAHSGYFYLGYGDRMRDSIARILPYWNSNIPYYNYLYGMYSFGLVESNQIYEARKAALTSLEFNKTDAWATHAICHCNEYSCEYEQGIDFLLKTEQDWMSRNFIAEHNYWHLALFYLQLDKQEEVIKVFEDHMMKTNSNLDMINSSSLLLRLKIDNEERYNLNNFIDEKYNELKEIFKTRIEEHGYTFSASHIGLILSACGSEEEKKQYLDAFEAYMNNNLEDNYLKEINASIGGPLVKSIIYFNEKNYDKVCELMYPIRNDLFKIGGSKAQKDLFHQMLLHSALSSTNYKNIGIDLLNERLDRENNKSNLTIRISNKYGL